MIVVDALVSLLSNNVGARISFRREGIKVFIPFGHRQETELFPAGSSSHIANRESQARPASEPVEAMAMPRISVVRLGSTEFDGYLASLLAGFSHLAAGEQGVVDLRPGLDYAQVYEIMRQLRREDFKVRPGAKSSPGRNGGYKYTFILTEAGSVRLFVQRRPTEQDSFGDGGAQVAVHVPNADLEGRTMGELLEIVPVNAAVAQQKIFTDTAADANCGGKRLAMTQGRNSQDTKKLLAEVRDDLRQRGVAREPLDWSLVKPPRSHAGSRFWRRGRDTRPDDRLRG